MDSQTDVVEAHVWSQRSETLYQVMVSYRYHRKRQRFYDLLDKFTKALTVIAGASLLAEPIKRNLPIAAAVISSLGMLSLVFGFGDRKQLHKELAEAFAQLAAKIRGASVAALSPLQAAAWEAEAAVLDVKEPPQLKALVNICEREQSIANGHPSHIPQIPFVKRALSDWISFG